MRKTFIDVLNQRAVADSVYIVSGDAGYGVFEEFRENHPRRFINTGVAEANMIGYSAGMAMAGFNVVVYNIIPFVLYRCYEQVRNDLCYQKLPVTLVGIGCGLTYAPQGMTHYSVEDLTVCMSLPNLTVLSPCDPVETRSAVGFALNSDLPVYIRLAKTGEPVTRPDACEDIRTPAIIRDGSDAVILSYGTVVGEAAAACDILEKKGIGVRLVSVPMIQPFPGDKIMDLISGYRHVLVLEEHFRSGGLATRLADYCMNRQFAAVATPLAIPDRFIHSIKKQDGMRRFFNIDAESIAKSVEKKLTFGAAAEPSSGGRR
jgi:transketolase